MYACENDVLEHKAVGSKTTVSEYTVIAKKDENDNSIIKKVTLAGKPDISTSDTPVSGLVDGQSDVTVTGTMTGWDKTDELVPVTDISSQLLITGEETGFYIQTTDGRYLKSTIKYGRDDGKNDENRLETTAILSEAALWYLEKDGNNYRLYTYCAINDPDKDDILTNPTNLTTYTNYPAVYNDAFTVQKRYLSHRGGKGYFVVFYNQLGYDAAVEYQNLRWANWPIRNWDRDLNISPSNSTTNGFTIQLTSNYHTSGAKNFIKNGSNLFEFNTGTATVLKFYKPPIGEHLAYSSFESTTFSPTVGSTVSGTISNATVPNDTQLSNYEDLITAYDDSIDTETDHSYEVYNITVTTVENVYEYRKNNSPYVTTNPKFNMANGQFLTGDGVSSYNYASTAFKSIIDDQKNESAKAYTICPTQLGLTENAEALSNLRKELSTSYAEFRSYINANGNQGMKNFPLFVAEDTTEATLTALINNYLQTLTNTNFNYADTTKTNIYEVGLYKCVFDPGSGEFVVDTGSSNLKRKSPGGEYYFYMEAKDVDTQDVPQFTLMDIKFKDPSDASKIAYHLYVPVYVKKVLRFDFNAHIKSGTDYYWSAYDKVSNLRNQGLFENLGNSVSIAFEWDYDRSAKEWADAVNGGDSLLTNYCKSFMLKRHNDTGDTDWAANTKMVLVDANRQGKMYYLDDPPSTTSLGTLFSLYDFTDSEGEHYKPVDFIDLMTVTVEQSDDGSLTTEGATDANATVKVGSTLYRPIMENDSIAVANRYTVTSVTPPDPERYYLSIFTKADPNATKVYHYELYSPDSFDSAYMDDATKWRANKINDSKNTAMHLFTGDLYDNDLALKVESRTKQRQMSSDNDFLTITMTANIRLTDTAIAVENNINGNMDTFKDNAEIYQTFLMMYDKLQTVGGTSEVGIDLEAGSDPVGSIKYYYKPGVISGQLENVNLIPDNENDYGATKITGYDKIVSDKYVELRNNLSGNQNLIDLLSDDSNNNAVTIQAKFDMVYAASELVYQFPKRDESAEGELGSSVIGYSRIASTKESAAYSATSQKAEDDTRYYTADESTAKLTYNVVESPITDPVGPFSSLGINSVETANPYSSFVDTIAVYDISKLKNPGEYVELAFSLSKRSNYNSALPIESYLDGVTIYGSDQDSDGTEDVIFLQTADSITTGDNRRTDKGTTEYKVRVKKNLLKTQPGGAFIIPIHFNVKTGDLLFNAQTGGLEYSNYKVTITAKMYSTIDGNEPLAVSQASDHIIYTNARVVPSVIE